MKIEKLACPNCNAPLTGNFAPNQRIECSHCGTPLLLTHLDANNPIFCPDCNTLNTDEVRYCFRCGFQLKAECVLCHTQNRIDTNYCVKCGVHLERAKNKRRLLQEANVLLRQERLEILKEKEARQKQEKIERLIEALDEPENHDLAIFQLNQIGADAVEALIDTLLNDPDVDARYGSARALGQIMAAQDISVLDRARSATVKALIEALNDSELPVRFWAANALGKCKSNLAIEPLAQLLKARHKGLREVARKSLICIGGKRVEDILGQRRIGWLF